METSTFKFKSRYIDFHAIQMFPLSCLNRDDTGSPKDCMLGGTRRARVSSQCFKKAMRDYLHGVMPNLVSTRTRYVSGLISQDMLKRHSMTVPPIDVQKIISSIDQFKTDQKDPLRITALVALSKKEIEELSDYVKNVMSQPATTATTTTTTQQKGKKTPSGQQQQAQGVQPPKLTSPVSVDIGLFGRMMASLPDANQDAACQVAHWTSTGAVERIHDFYTATDDKNIADMGSAMMGVTELNQAVYYRYASIDVHQLYKNLGNDENLTKQALKVFAEAFVFATPSGKKNSTAPSTLPDYVCIRHTHRPQNLIQAFEVADCHTIQDSVKKFKNHKTKRLGKADSSHEYDFFTDNSDLGTEESLEKLISSSLNT